MPEESKLPSKRAKLLKEEPKKETRTKTKSTIFQVINTSSITRSLAIFWYRWLICKFLHIKTWIEALFLFAQSKFFFWVRVEILTLMKSKRAIEPANLCYFLLVYTKSPLLLLERAKMMKTCWTQMWGFWPSRNRWCEGTFYELVALEKTKKNVQILFCVVDKWFVTEFVFYD